MFGSLRTRRIFRCTGRVWSTEALLLSVLKHQSTSLPNSSTALFQEPPDFGAAARGGIRIANSDEQSDSTDAPSSEDHRAVPGCLQNKEDASPGFPLCQPAAPTRSSLPAASQSDSEHLGCSPLQGGEYRTSQGAGNESLCFTLVAAEMNPSITFPEMLMQWECFVEGYGVHYAEQLSPDLRLREASLLNLKLEDPVLGHLVAMKGASHLFNGAPKYIADVLQSEVQRGVRFQTTDGTMDRGCSTTPLACYGLPHFSAELGDVGYLHSLLRLFPHGFPLRFFSTPPRFARSDEVEKGVFFGEAKALNNVLAMSSTMSGVAHQALQAPGRPAELHSFAQIAAQCPDHFGLYLSHLAGLRGHIAYIVFLIETLGAEFVLQKQRCVPPISTSYAWGAQRYLNGLNATQCAIAGQQIALLEWMEKEHSFALQELRTKAIMDALMVAVMSKDGGTDVFDFFLARNMPFNTLFTADLESVSDKHVGAHRSVVGVWNQDLQDSGILRLLFAAAEVGNDGVLRWFDAALGRTDIRQLCDSHGATILHHCARGHNAPLLETLLPASAKDCGTTLEAGGIRWGPLNPVWVDVEDDQGRTPAMWCVMSAKHSKAAIETLEVLRKAGSNWPRRQQNGVSLLDVATRFVSRHSKLVRYLKAHIQPRYVLTVPTPA